MRMPLRANMGAGLPLPFCCDLGPGYHVSVAADLTGLRFAPGLGEMPASRQIHALGREVAQVYALAVSDELLRSHLRGVRLTKGTTTQCVGLVCLPGSDVRFQIGEVELLLAPWRPSVTGLDHPSQPCAVPESAGEDGLPAAQLPLPNGAVLVSVLRRC